MLELTHILEITIQSGVDVDEDSGRLFLLCMISSFPNYNRYLYEVNPVNPSSVNGTWLLGTQMEAMGSSSTQTVSGLIVDLPKIITNEYYRSKDIITTFHWMELSSSLWVKSRFLVVAIMEWTNWVMVLLDTNVITLHHIALQPSTKYNAKELASTYDFRTVSSTSSVVTSSTKSLSKIGNRNYGLGIGRIYSSQYQH